MTKIIPDMDLEQLARAIEPLLGRKGFRVERFAISADSDERGIYFNDIQTGVDTILPSPNAQSTGFGFYRDGDRELDYSVVLQVAPQVDRKAFYVSLKENTDGTIIFGVVASGSSLRDATLTNVAGSHTPYFTMDKEYRTAAGTDNVELRSRTLSELTDLVGAKLGKVPLVEVLPAIAYHVNRVGEKYFPVGE